MKRLILILIALLMVLFTFSSCYIKKRTPGDEQTEQTGGDKYTDNYIYANMNGTFYRFNAEAGSASPLCPDPLCKHSDENCPFFGMNGNPVFAGQYVYYLAGATDASEATKLCQYNLQSGKYVQLYEPESGTLSGMNVYDEYVYFNQSRLKDGGGVEFVLMKYSLHNKKATALTDETQSVPQYFLSADDGKIYWYTSAGEHYSTDTEYKNRIDGDTGYADRLSNGNYAFVVEPTGEMGGVTGSKLPAFRLLRKDKDTGETITVIEEMCSFPTVYNGNILYYKFQDTVPFIGYMYDEYSGNRIAVTDKNGGKLYVCDLDGNNEHVLCDISDSGCTFTNVAGVAGKSGTGDYIGVELRTYEKDGEYVKESESALLIVNIKTGESKIVRTE